MSRNRILVLVIGCALLGAACQQAERAAKETGASMEQHAGDAAQLAEDAASKVEQGAGQLSEQAKEAAAKLDAEARAMYDKLAAEMSKKQEELKTLEQKLAEMSPQDLVSGDGKKMKDKADSLTTEIGSLEKKIDDLLGQTG